jgi:flagellar biosynthesis component FlhA
VPIALEEVDVDASAGSRTAALGEVLRSIVAKHLAEFMGHQEWLSVLEMQSSDGDTTWSDLRSPESLSALVSVGRALLMEQVPLTPFEPLLRVVADGVRAGEGVRAMAEAVRNDPEVRGRLPGNRPRRQLVKTSATFEQVIRQSLHRRDPVTVLAMDPESCQEALRAIREEIAGPRHVLIVEDHELRPFVARLVETEFPEVAVLARRELVSASEVQATLPELDHRGTGPRPATHNLRVVTLGAPPTRATSIGVEVQVAPGLLEAHAEEGTVGLDHRMFQLQDDLFFECGILVPDPVVTADTRLTPDTFRVRVNGREAQAHAPGTNSFMVDMAPEEASRLGVAARSIVHPEDGVNRAVVTAEQLSQCGDKVLTTWGPQAYVALEVEHQVRAAAAEFFTEPVARFAWDQVAQLAPDLVRLARERFGADVMADVVRALLRDGIPVRDLRGVLEALLSINGVLFEDLSTRIVFSAHADSYCVARGVIDEKRLGPIDLAEHVRTWLKAVISHTFSGGAATLAVYLLDPEMEQWISTARSPQQEDRGRDFLAAIRAEVASRRMGGPPPIILTTLEVRHLVHEMVRESIPGLVVLSYQELSAHLNIQPVARISWS